MDFFDRRYFLYRNVLDYSAADDNEELSKDKVIELLTTSANPFDNNNLPGHITGSALVVDRDFTSTLLTHHATLNKWFQFGGHSDDDNNTFNVAMREAFEESGLKNLSFHYPYSGIFDIDFQPIPANERLCEHSHYDIRILLIADINEPCVINHESKELKWVKLEDVGSYNSQPAFIRLVEKARAFRK